jgi:hypothetical protein
MIENCQFSTDATKLIAADSRLEPGDFSRDPEATKAFEDVTTVLANGQPTAFFMRTNLEPAELGPVSQAWISLAAEIEPSECTEIPISDAITEAFAKTFTGDMAMRATDWCLFQLSNLRLLRIFWRDNKEQDLLDVGRAFEKAGSVPDDLRSVAIRRIQDYGLDPVKQCRLALATLPGNHHLSRHWSSESMVVAYLGWAYVKGYRYAATRKDAHNYLFHFVRKTAVSDNSAARIKSVSGHIQQLFPWGILINAFLTRWPTSVDATTYRTIIDGIRDYTSQDPARDIMGYLQEIKDKGESSDEATKKHLRKEAIRASQRHARGGLSQSIPISKMDFDHIWDACKYVSQIIGLLATQWTGEKTFPWWFSLALIEFHLETIKWSLPLETKEEIMRQFALVESDFKTRRLMRANRDEVIAYVDHALNG